MGLTHGASVDRSRVSQSLGPPAVLDQARLDPGACKSQVPVKVLPHGVFTLPVLLSPLQFYGCLSQQQNMMQDFVRTATYHRAILQNHTDFRDKVMVAAGY